MRDLKVGRKGVKTLELSSVLPAEPRSVKAGYGGDGALARDKGVPR